MSDARRFLIVSGLSGAGKSIALHALEDAGFYCVDNLPVGILPDFAHFIAEQNQPHFDKVAVGIDARNQPDALSSLPAVLDTLGGETAKVELIFVDASDETLLRRFSETRRKHPLSSEQRPLPDAIALERGLLDPLATRADIRIDTTRTNIHEFRAMIRELITKRPAGGLALQFQSFGFKHGVPSDADFVFDVRCLPNPYWDVQLHDLSGRDRPVRDYLDSASMAQRLALDIGRFLETWVEQFEEVNRTYLTIAFGCTGGRHRSVYMAERMAREFAARGKRAAISHRDL